MFKTPEKSRMARFHPENGRPARPRRSAAATNADTATDPAAHPGPTTAAQRRYPAPGGVRFESASSSTTSERWSIVPLR